MLLGIYHPEVNGTIYFAKITMLIWQAILCIWSIRNNHLHPGNPEQEDHSQLQPAMNQDAR